MEGLGEGEMAVGLGVEVAVALTGGVTRSSNFCPGRIMEVGVNPFQAISSASGMSYRTAIPESVSPLWTME